MLFDSEIMTVWYHHRWALVHHKVHRQVSPEFGGAFMEALDKGSDALRRYQATKWLSDDRNHYVLPLEVQDWCQKEWFPKTKQAGWRYWAVVEPVDSLAKLNIARVATTFKSLGVCAKLFTTVDEGRAWLLSADSKAPEPKAATR